jgi:ComF family protein
MLCQCRLSHYTPHKVNHNATSICTACYITLPWFQYHGCPFCHKNTLENQICSHCLIHPKAYDNVHVCFYYQTPISNWIVQFKSNKKMGYGRNLAKLFAHSLNQATHQPPDLILAIPLYKKVIKQRGFNQTHELAKQIGKSINRPYAPKGLIKKHPNRMQKKLNRQERIKNVQGVFKVTIWVDNLHIALIDDVMTTGSTLNEAAKELKKHGAKQVDVWCIARQS